MTSADIFTRACPVWRSAVAKGSTRGEAFEITGGKEHSGWILVAFAAAVVGLAIWGMG